ncbi:hypothetical protein [Brevundimonas lenta]|uniref:Uncharacterized protein YjeT (DUF2065 family) n=1 Tax=Brevundimonas lenta TaxID=424796 RepID=A0A7W6JCX7_9CAUL|nr:hypothetical protein [Brevundimonas lenta]MBB4082829.1 uncharacterized protein YjeT (DUF2065 family) [Brevundimonas lenta]
MIGELSRTVAVVLGLWLVGVSVFMFVSPARAVAALAKMGGSATIHFGELGLRTVGGIALILAASLSRFPEVIAAIGWFLVASALVLMVLPRRWHAAYSQYWARRIRSMTVRLAASASVIAGGALIWAVI